LNNSKIRSQNSKYYFQDQFLLNLKKIRNEIIKLIVAEIKNGTEEPNISHKTPVKNDPSIIAKLDSIVSNPIAEPRCSLGIKSEIHALATPSVVAA
jgi:hypothetical protein